MAASSTVRPAGAAHTAPAVHRRRTPRGTHQAPGYPGRVKTRVVVNRLTLREQVLDDLRDAITTGRLEPDAPLIETELAETYQVSRGTVREALRFLQEAGLVAGDARGKLRVHRPTAREISELFHVRAALEGLALREIIASPDRSAIAADLRGHLPPQGGGTFISRLDLDLAFHERMCQASGNATLHSLWKRIEDRMRVVLLYGAGDEPLPIMAGDQHAPIVDAIERGDAPDATQLVFDHMATAAQFYTDALG